MRHWKALIVNPKSFKCDEPDCDFASSRAKGLENHQRLHKEVDKLEKEEMELDLDPLAAATTDDVKVKIDEIILSEEKPFKCTEVGCEYVSSRAKGLRKHLHRCHSGEDRPYKCVEPGCGYSSKQRSRVEAHYKRRHSEVLIVE